MKPEEQIETPVVTIEEQPQQPITEISVADQFKATALKAFEETVGGDIDAILKKYEDVKIIDVNDKIGYNKNRESYTALRKYAIAVEKRSKSMTASLNDQKKLVKEAEQTIVKKFSDVYLAMQAREQEIDNQNKILAAQKANERKMEVRDWIQQLAQYTSEIDAVAIEAMGPEEFKTKLASAKKAHEDLLAEQEREKVANRLAEAEKDAEIQRLRDQLAQAQATAPQAPIETKPVLQVVQEDVPAYAPQTPNMPAIEPQAPSGDFFGEANLPSAKEALAESRAAQMHVSQNQEVVTDVATQAENARVNDATVIRGFAGRLAAVKLPAVSSPEAQLIISLFELDLQSIKEIMLDRLSKNLPGR